MKYLWRFEWDCGRDGDIKGLFVATEKEIEDAIDKDVYFGEVLGKHSEVYGFLGEDDVTKIDIDANTVEKVANVLGETWSGYNPLKYIQYHCPKCG